MDYSSDEDNKKLIDAITTVYECFGDEHYDWFFESGIIRELSIYVSFNHYSVMVVKINKKNVLRFCIDSAGRITTDVYQESRFVNEFMKKCKICLKNQWRFMRMNNYDLLKMIAEHYKKH